MKFYVTLLFVMFVTLSHTKAEASYLARNFKQEVFPVSYSSRILRFPPIRRCFKCQNRTQKPDEYLFRPYGLIGVRDESKINFMRGFTPMHEKDQAYNGRRTSTKNTSPIFKVHQVTNILKSNTKNSIVSLDASDTKKLEGMKNLAEIVKNCHSVVNNNAIIAANANKKDKTKFNTTIERESISKAIESQGNIIEGQYSTVEFKNQDILPSEIKVAHMNQNYLDAQNGLIFALNQFEHQLFLANFLKFSSLIPASKGDSGMSFVQSGLFLEMALMALSTEVDLETKNEIDQNFVLNVPDLDKVELIRQVMSSLPNTSEDLKFRWASRLMLRSGRQLSQDFITGTAKALQLKIDHFEDAQTPQAMAQVLNRMIEEDSGGAIRDTFEEEELSENEEAVLITTLYFRARWRTAPTLLNGTQLFRNSGNAPLRTIKMIRVNDIMKYVDLPEWDAEALEIPYLTEGLSLLMLVPRDNSLKRLVKHVTVTNLTCITERMQSIRVAATLPLYTLRMTLLLPNKLQAMGISRIVNVSEAKDDSLRISQAVQRIMFWAEAGRNAFKDDGLEWDEPPEMKISIDRPYMFYVRWQSLNLITGNFVL